MSSHAIPTKAGTVLVLEPTLPEFRRWNGASLARTLTVSDWASVALEDAANELPTAFTEEDLERQFARAIRQPLVLDLSPAEAERLAAAALAATYPPKVCYRIGRRRKPTRYWGTLLLGAWAHAVLNRAAAGADHETRPSPRLVAVPPLPANVIPFPKPPRQAR